MATVQQTTKNTSHQFGGDGSGFNEMYAESITFPSNGTVTDITLNLANVASPTDGVKLGLQSDSSGSPDGVYLGSGTIDNTALSGTLADATISGLSISVNSGTTYWLVNQRTGAQDGTNMYVQGFSNTDTYAGTEKARASSSWSTQADEDLYFIITYTVTGGATNLSTLRTG